MKKGILKWIIETQGVKIIGLFAVVLIGWIVGAKDYFDNGEVIGLVITAILTVIYFSVFGLEYIKYRNGN
ncbi:MAG: hypothetical protein S4CHLAM20_04610 [Chlamydiia bacterium]|nr:hypothetical protein [Chlamydiia bacterium]